MQGQTPPPQSPPLPLVAQWSLADLLDYELLVNQREAETDKGSDSIEERALIRTKIHEALDLPTLNNLRLDTQANRRWWLLRWVHEKRAQRGWKEESPGQICASAISTTSLVLSIIGAITGFIILKTIVTSSGSLPGGAPIPVNVGLTLAVCLLPQVFLLCAALWFMMFGFSGFLVRPPRGIRWLGALLLTPILTRLALVGAQHLDRERITEVHALVALLVSRTRLHFRAITWHMLGWFHWTAATYSLVMVGGLLLLLQVKHIPFGWQTSTLLSSSETVHALVRGIAFPWSWLFGEGSGYPSYEQIQKSQIFINEPIQPGPDTRTALTVWWPFLVLSLFVYASLPRFLLLAFTLFRQQRSLREESFEDSRSQLLFKELSRQEVKWKSAATNDTETSSCPTPLPPMSPSEPLAARRCLAALPAPLDNQQNREILRQSISENPGWEVAEFLDIYGPKNQKIFLEKLHLLSQESSPLVLIVKRGNDPIVNDLRYFVDDLLGLLGSKGHLLFGIAGRHQLLEDSASLDELQIWKEFADTLKLKNPNVEAIRLKKS